MESQSQADVMLVRLSALVASILAVLAISSAGAAAHPRHHHHRRPPVRLPADYGAWSRVAICEEGGWLAPGGDYPDALGIDAANFAQFGGRPDYGRLSLRARVREIRVADRLIRYYHVGVPDQGGCAAW